MHLIESVHNLIDKAVRLSGGQPIKNIRATLGALTGFTSDQVLAEFERSRAGTPAAGAALTLRLEPGRVVCLSCEQAIPVVKQDEACPACGSYRRQILAGSQLLVEGVSVDRSATAAGRAAVRRRRAAASLASVSAEGDWDA